MYMKMKYIRQTNDVTQFSEITKFIGAPLMRKYYNPLIYPKKYLK